MIFSDIDEYTCDLYTSGDCYVLAKELFDQGIGELAAVVVKGQWECWSHMAVKVGPDSYLDVEGLSSSEELAMSYARGGHNMTVIPINEEEYFEMIEGQARQMRPPYEVTQLAYDLIDWLRIEV